MKGHWKDKFGVIYDGEDEETIREIAVEEMTLEDCARLMEDRGMTVADILRRMLKYSVFFDEFENEFAQAETDFMNENYHWVEEDE